MNKKDYYTENALTFFKSTFNVDMSEQYAFFTKQINSGRIIDLGCGSGRDSKFLMNKGFDVISIDNNILFNELAKNKLDIIIKNMDIRDVTYDNIDGIWACASLLHFSSNELINIFSKMYKEINNNAVIYCSFKLGEFEGERNGRFFNDMTIEKLQPLINEFKIIDSYISDDVRKERNNEKWLNVILKK